MKKSKILVSAVSAVMLSSMLAAPCTLWAGRMVH